MINFNKDINFKYNFEKEFEYLKNSNMNGWTRLNENIQKIQEIKFNSEYLVVIGVGGSYLGAKAVIDALTSLYDNKVIFIGNSLSSKDLKDTVEFLKDKDFAINVISKSGTTLETAIAFRIIKNLLKEKYDNYLERIIITTDKEKGLLKKYSDKYNIQTFVLPEDIGGRYSVLSAVGLIPIHFAKIDINKIIDGAKKAKENTIHAEKYAYIRNYLYTNGKKVELFISYEPRLRFFLEWLKQLYAESEGKENKGIFLASAIFTSDLHSIGQFLQEGDNNYIFETIININNDEKLYIQEEENFDGLNYLTNLSISEINKRAMIGTKQAHDNLPIISINIEKLDEFNIGYLIYFFEIACVLSSRMLNVNPFDQPGVELYKKNMYKLLETKEKN